MASVKKAPPQQIVYWAMNAQFCDDTQYSCWNKSQSANEDEVRFSTLAGLASTCLVDGNLVGSQLSPGTPSSLPRDKMVSNQLSLYSSFLAFQAQHASSGHNKIIISALRNFQDDKPEEKEEEPLPSFFDHGILQPSEVGTDNEIKPETTPPVKRVARSRNSMATFFFPEVVEQPSDDDSGPEGSLTGSDAAEAPALGTKKAGSRALHRLLIKAVDELARLPLWLQATHDSCGTSLWTTRLRLQYLTRLPSRLDHRTA
jgi:hypothetical protein